MEITKNDKIILRSNNVQKAVQYAELAGCELGLGIKMADGRLIKYPGDLAGILTSLEAHDLLVLYNIELLDDVILDYLHGAIQNQRIEILIDKGPSARSIEIDINPFLPILILKDNEYLPDSLEGLCFKKYNVGDFIEASGIREQIEKQNRKNLFYTDDSFIFLYYEKVGNTFASLLCEELKRLDISYKTHCLSIFEGIQTIKKQISIISQAKLFVLLVNRDNYDADYMKDLISLGMNSSVLDSNLIDKPIAYLIDDIDVSSQTNYSHCYVLRSSDYPSPLGLASYIYCMLGNDLDMLVKTADDCRSSGRYIDAYNMYKRPSEIGHAGAQYGIGVMYLEGNGLQKDVTEGLKWITISADQGYEEAQKCLYRFYSGQEGHEPNYSEAIKWGLLLKDNQNVDADFWNAIPSEVLCEEGMSHLKNQERDRGMFFLYNSGERGSLKALYNLAMFYYKSNVDLDKNLTNIEMALKLFASAAEKGHAGSQFYVGFFYEKGLGVPSLIDNAIEWYQKAADQNYPKAQERVDALKLEKQRVEALLEEAKRQERERIARKAQMESEKREKEIIRTDSEDKLNEQREKLKNKLKKIPKWLWIFICLVLFYYIYSMPFSNSYESKNENSNMVTSTQVDTMAVFSEGAITKDYKSDNTTVSESQKETEDTGERIQKEIEEEQKRIQKVIEEEQKRLEKSKGDYEKSKKKADKKTNNDDWLNMSHEEYEKRLEEENAKREKEFYDRIYGQ